MAIKIMKLKKRKSKPYFENQFGQVYLGNVLPILKTLPSNSIHMCVTSPPYWGLRDYGNPPQIWDEPSFGYCKQIINNRETSVKGKHEWEDKNPIKTRKDPKTGIAISTDENRKKTVVATNQFCKHCNAWKGDLGSEPTPDLFIQHLTQIFREVRRVLRDDGILFLNIGDTYTGTGGSLRINFGKIKPLTTYPSATKIPEGLKHNELIGIPWKLAFALQKDGWRLRQDIIWSKRSVTPESCTNRCTKSHEYIFILAKSAKYFYDNFAVRQPTIDKQSFPPKENTPYIAGGNKRSVWTIDTDKRNNTDKRDNKTHFAVFPEKLVRTCISLGSSEKGCCPQCGKPWERHIKKHRMKNYIFKITNTEWKPACECKSDDTYGQTYQNPGGEDDTLPFNPIPCTVLEPFLGSGTTFSVASILNRRCIGIDVSKTFLDNDAIPHIEKEARKQRQAIKSKKWFK